MAEPREQLASRVRHVLADQDICGQAELHLLDGILRDRLALLGIEPTPDVAVAIMATAMLLSERSPEWGGDARDALRDAALLGLSLLGTAPSS